MDEKDLQPSTDAAEEGNPLKKVLFATILLTYMVVMGVWFGGCVITL